MAAKSKIFVEAPPQDVFEVITDYESYLEFIPEINSVKMLEEGKDHAVVDFLFNAGKTINYVLRFTPKPYESLSWTLVRGDMKSNEGSWTLKPQKNGTEVTYQVSMDFGMLVPRFVVSMVTGAGLPGILKRFKQRVETGEAKRVISLQHEVDFNEMNIIRRYLRRNQYDVKNTAIQLSITPSELSKKIKKYSLS